MKLFLGIVIILVLLFSCQEKVEPKECWVISPGCTYTSESMYFFGVKQDGTDTILACDLTENEVRMKVIELRTVAANYNTNCNLTYKIKK